jgi:hypothetical protein
MRRMQALEIVPIQPVSTPVATSAAERKRTSHLKRGSQPGERWAALHERASIALGGMFGADVREVAYCVTEGVKRKTISVPIARMILERSLPSSRPVQIDLPVITGPQDVIEAEEKIMRAVNEARISPQEARTLQALVKSAYRSRRVANVDMGERL